MNKHRKNNFISNDIKYTQATEEIRFAKGQQYNTIYYSLLAYSGIITLFQLNVQIPFPFYKIFKVAAIIIAIIIFRITSQIQWDHFKALNEYRIGLEKIEGQVNINNIESHKSNKKIDWLLYLLSGKELPNTKSITKAVEKISSSKRYVFIFHIVNFLAMIISIIVTVFDS